MSSAARFASLPRRTNALVSAAQTTRDNPGSNVVTVFAAGANGSRIENVRVQATGTTTAGVVRLYISDGTTHALWREVLVPAITPSTTVSPFAADIDLSLEACVLVAGQSIRATTHNAEAFRIHVSGGDFGAVPA